jgi:formylmethanofuran--tetrahydromethanopterin N-formyltransferase
MEGDFIIEDSLGYVDGIAGGNFIIMAESQASALMAAKAAVDAISNVEGVITPFPIVASGSKVGSKYRFLKASTNEKFCPSLRDKVESELPSNVKGVYEIVINGISLNAVKEAMRVGISVAMKIPGVVKITAANFDGKLGRHKIWLSELFD